MVVPGTARAPLNAGTLPAGNEGSEDPACRQERPEMYCHTPPPMPGWRPTNHKLPLLDDELPFPPDLEDIEPDPLPEPPEYGPAPSVIVH